MMRAQGQQQDQGTGTPMNHRMAERMGLLLHKGGPTGSTLPVWSA
jgi:hypothetical protein